MCYWSSKNDTRGKIKRYNFGEIKTSSKKSQ
jgi:hypothetical protein